MEWLARFGQHLRSQFNLLLHAPEDPEQRLEQIVYNLQEELIRLRQAVAQAIATHKRCQRQQSQAVERASNWQQRARMLLQQQDELAARVALQHYQSYWDQAETLRTQLQEQQQLIRQLKHTMAALEVKLATARARKDLYLARARAATASQDLQQILAQIDQQFSLGAFAAMEIKVQQLEAEAEVANLSWKNELEQQFATLEQTQKVEQQLQLLKRELTSTKRVGMGMGEMEN